MAPRCLALVIADAINKDPTTNKHSILGTFGGMQPSEFPCRAQLSVFFVLVNCHGPCKMALRLVRASEELLEDEQVFVAEFEVGAKDPLQEVTGAMTFQGEIPQAGVYFLQLVYADYPIMERRLVVRGGQT